jgi:esterase/lipase superfamily enzyme
VRTEEFGVSSLAIGDSRVIVYGHYGQPLLAFPSDAGVATDWENLGMIGAVADLIDAGRVKIYTIDSYDNRSWRNDSLPLEARAQEHRRFEDFVLHDVLPRIYDDCGGPQDVFVAGVSFGAFHAANAVLKFGHVFPFGICMSGVYDMSKVGWGERGEALYFANPLDYVANLHGDHLDWLRGRVSLQLVCGQGAWEDETTGALDSTRRFDALLTEKGIPHETDLWGFDTPHDWPSWQRQLAHHLPRFV